MNSFRCPSFPKHCSRLSIIWIVPSIGVTSFRSASFLFCLSSGCPPIEIAVLAVFQDRRGICQFVPLDHHPRLPTYSFSLPSALPLHQVLSTTVPSPIHLLFRFFTEFRVLSSLLFTNISSTSSPILLFHLFISILFFFHVSVFSVSSSFSSYRSTDLISRIFQRFFFFFICRGSFFRLARKKSRRF